MSCDHGINYFDVLIIKFLDDPGFLRSATATQDSAIVVSYQISQLVRNYSSSYTAYQDIVDSLSEAVADGYFTAYLRGFADIMDINSLAEASSTELLITSFTPAPSLSPTRPPKPQLSSGSIAAIVICSVFGCCLFCGFLCLSSREEIMRNQQNAPKVAAAETATTANTTRPKKPPRSTRSVHSSEATLTEQKDVEETKEYSI
jgi:hypothetical protein